MGLFEGFPSFIEGRYSLETLIRWGGFQERMVVQGEIWRIPISIFIHSSWQHIGSNLLGLLFLTRRAEKLFGYRRTSIVILISEGIFFALVCLIREADIVHVGISVTIMALLGLMSSYPYYFYNVIKQPRISYHWVFLVFVIYIGLFGGGDRFGHSLGLTTGFIIGYCMLHNSQQQYLKR
ncbi:MAG: rhomboid family intramembrane serine protease [Patescibacteria group bacterium]